MKELNPLVLALNDIDTRYIVEPKRRKRPIVLMIAAAAAAMTLLTGFTVRILTADTPGVNVNYENLFGYNVTVREMRIPAPEEMYEFGATGGFDEYQCCTYRGVGKPSELLKMFDAEPLFNADNFTDEPTEYTVSANLGHKEDGVETHFTYKLVDKESGLNVEVFSVYNNTVLASSQSTPDKNDSFRSEVITLNDGSKAYVCGDYFYSSSEFSYHGAIHTIFCNTGFEDMFRIMRNLGVL